MLQNLSSKDSRIVYARTGYSVITNQFAVVLKETKYAALLMGIPSRTISGYWQEGFEVPDIGSKCLEGLTADNVFRAKRSVSDGKVRYWNGHDLFRAWNGEPVHFNLCD